MSTYYSIMKAVWEKCSGGATDATVLFSKNDLQQVAHDLNMPVKNIADIKYTFDSRIPLVLDKQNYCIVQRSKGQYALMPIVGTPLITPDRIDNIFSFSDLTPPAVKSLLGQDEQAALSRMEWNNVLPTILGTESVYKVQDHWRTTCSTGQIEVDSLFVASGTTQTVFLCSVKKYPDQLSQSYLFNLGVLAKEKFADRHVLLVNIYMMSDSYWVWTCEPTTSVCTPKVLTSAMIIFN